MIVVVNKIDKVKNVGVVINFLVEKFGVFYGEVNEIFVLIFVKFGKNFDVFKVLMEKKRRKL